MEFIIGVAIGAGALAVVMMISMAKAAKEADETESSLIKQRIAQIKAELHHNSDNE